MPDPVWGATAEAKRPRVVSFDVGGVIDTAPEKFAMLMADLRRRGARVIVVTAVYNQAQAGVLDAATRTAFSHGRLWGMGVRYDEHYDGLYAVPLMHDGGATGIAKGSVLHDEAPVLHVDDNAEVCSGIVVCPTHVFDGDLLAVTRAIDAALEGAA